jgi:hypothetical protein
MAIKFERIEAGQILYDRHRTRMGNTTMTQLGEWSVQIVSIDKEKGTARVRWNGNPEQTYFRHSLEKLFRSSMYDKKPAKP